MFLVCVLGSFTRFKTQTSHSKSKAVNPHMQNRCGADAAVVMAKIANTENMNV